MPERKATAVLLGIASAVFVALRVPCANIPLERDEGGYAFMVQRALQGDVPYRDVWDQKPPGVYVAYLPAVSLAGGSPVAIHLTAYAADMLTAWFLFRIVRRLAGSVAAGASVLFLAVLAIEPAWLATAANTEHFMIVFMAASTWCLLKGEESARNSWWVACGLTSEAAPAIDRQREAWAEILRARPRAILVTAVATSLLEKPGTPTYLRDRVADLLKTGWTLEAVRTFDVPHGRMVFGSDARRAAWLNKWAKGPPVDMLLFVRS